MSVRRKDSALPFYDQVLKPESYAEVCIPPLFSFGDDSKSSQALHLEDFPLSNPIGKPSLNKIGTTHSGVFGGWSSLDSIHEHQNDEDNNNPFAFAPYSEYLSDDSSSQASPYHSPIYADDYYQEQPLDTLPPYIKMRYAIRALESKAKAADKPAVQVTETKTVTRKRKRKRQDSSPSRYQPTRDEPEVKRRKKTSRNNYPRSSSDQHDCCIKGCTNSVTNRLRFSLRCTQPEDYKPDYLEKSFNKVCHHHYFSDLYKFKKAQK